MSTESIRKAVKKYDAAHTRFIGLKLNLKTDKDILDYLELRRESGEGYQTVIKDCIRSTMADYGYYEENGSP